MKFSLSRETLLRTLAFAKAVAERKSSIPILTHVLIEGRKNAVRFLTTDLEVTLDTALEAEVTDSGDGATVSAARLHDIVRESAEGADISFEFLKDSKVKIQAATASFKVPTLPAADFPTVPKYAGEQVSVPAKELAEALSRVAFVRGDDEKYYLKGARLIVRAGELEMTATDGHQLAHTVLPIDTTVTSDVLAKGLIVPSKTLDELGRLLDTGVERVGIRATDSGVTFTVGRYTLTSKINEGAFPKVEPVLAERKGAAQFVVQREVLAAALRRVRLMAEGVGVGLTIKKGLLIVAAEGTHGQAVDMLTIAYDGPEVTVGVNAGFPLAFLDATASGDVVIQAVGPDANVRFEPVEGDGRFVFVAMPMRLNR